MPKQPAPTKGRKALERQTERATMTHISVGRTTHEAADQQRTLNRSVSCVGVGLHCGVPISLTIHPAKTDSGIVFRRTDLPEGRNRIGANWGNVVDTVLCTVLGNEYGHTVSTVEHLMAALAGCGIDNAVIDIDGAEIPIMDGSAAPFVDLIDQAGVDIQDKARRVIRVLRTVEVTEGDRTARLVPNDRLELEVAIDFDSKAIARQDRSVTLVNGAFRHDLASARTFGFKHEVEQLRNVGLARGGSLENAVVVDGDKILNAEGLRFDDEFVRHKLLDAVGDLALAGAPILGRFVGVRSGHRLNNMVLRALFADSANWCWATSIETKASFVKAPLETQLVSAAI